MLCVRQLPNLLSHNTSPVHCNFCFTALASLKPGRHRPECTSDPLKVSAIAYVTAAPDSLSSSPFYTIGLLFQAAFGTAKCLQSKECRQSFGVPWNKTLPVVLGNVSLAPTPPAAPPVCNQVPGGRNPGLGLGKLSNPVTPLRFPPRPS